MDGRECERPGSRALGGVSSPLQQQQPGELLRLGRERICLDTGRRWQGCFKIGKKGKKTYLETRLPQRPRVVFFSPGGTAASMEAIIGGVGDRSKGVLFNG